ncbi:sugar transferase [Candidatus Gottesmanbacteria bacterium]|nr:sugar transferase [Candidatus Gottesmanbacteria bacterium]
MFSLLYRQRRIGKNGKPFTMYKFRTMITGADAMQKKLSPYNEADGPVFKIRNDPRFTSIGKFLSHTGLDELPQLINVLRGEMAIIGPRPLPLAEAAKLTPWQKKRHRVKPGIISPWILEGYHAKSFDAWMKSDIEYIETKHVWKDMELGIRGCILLAKLFLREVASILSNP